MANRYKMKRTRLTAQDKRVIEAAKGRCFYCGFPITEDKPRDWLLINQRRAFAADHKQPRNRGGADTDDNLVCACWRCNSQKGAHTVDEYRLVRGLRCRDLNISFFGESPKKVKRDWLCVHSDEFIGSVLLCSMPSMRGVNGSWLVKI